MTAPAPAPSPARVVVLYTSLRLLMFLVLWLGLVLLGASTFAGALVAAVLTSLLSLVLLRRQRDAVSAVLGARVERRRAEQEELRRRIDEGPAGTG